MIDFAEGLKDRKEVLEDLRSFLQFEKELISDGFYTELDFDQEVLKSALKLMELHKSEWKHWAAPSGVAPIILFKR